MPQFHSSLKPQCSSCTQSYARRHSGKEKDRRISIIIAISITKRYFLPHLSVNVYRLHSSAEGCSSLSQPWLITESNVEFVRLTKCLSIFYTAFCQNNDCFAFECIFKIADKEQSVQECDTETNRHRRRRNDAQ